MVDFPASYVSNTGGLGPRSSPVEMSRLRSCGAQALLQDVGGPARVYLPCLPGPVYPSGNTNITWLENGTRI